MSKYNKQPKEIRDLCAQIMAMAVGMADSEHDVFVSYIAHVNQMEIRIYENGWQLDADPDIDTSIYLFSNDELFNTPENIIKELQDAVNTIKELKK